jgi:dihydroneopterin aldolase
MCPPRRVADLVSVRGLRVLGTHGVLDEELVRAQPFEVDVDVEVDLSAAGQSDDLADTLDYGALCEQIAAVVAGDHVALLERLAQRIADAVLASSPLAASARVTVRKLRPPVPVDVASAGVTITRRR